MNSTNCWQAPLVCDALHLRCENEGGVSGLKELRALSFILLSYVLLNCSKTRYATPCDIA